MRSISSPRQRDADKTRALNSDGAIPYELEVVDRRGHAIGELLDVMVDMRTGHIAYGVVGVRRGRDPERAIRQIAVPWSALYPDRIDDRLLIDEPRARIEGAPMLPPRSCSKRVARHWAKEVHDYFGCVPYWQEEVH